MAFSRFCGFCDEGGIDGGGGDGEGDVAFVAAWVSLVFGEVVLGVGGGLRRGIVICRIGFGG